MDAVILTINGGSSSVKFAVFEAEQNSVANLRRRLSGSIQRIGLPEARLQIRDADGKTVDDRKLKIGDSAAAAEVLIAAISQHIRIETVAAVGHRIVHGGPKHLDHAAITPDMLAELRRISAIDPDHLPGEITLIEAISKCLPGAPQVACFDTAFHRDLPTVAKILPIPRKYFDDGVRRYGFHGLSYSYLLQDLERIVSSHAKPQAANARVILAHLGNGCSMAAVRDGKCIDTTMSFTPTAGLVMGTRSGDLDPGALVYLMRQQKMDADQIDQLINSQSGLLGVSGISSDMRDLLVRREKNPNAALAVDLFCYQAKKWIGALAAALGGLDTLVFSGGIGEHAAEVRSQICAGLDHLGLHIDENRNSASAPIISSDNSLATVRIIPTDEEIMIARIVSSVAGVPLSAATDN